MIALYLEDDVEVVGLQVGVYGDEVGAQHHAVHPGPEPAAVLPSRGMVHEHRVTALTSLCPVLRTA